MRPSQRITGLNGDGSDGWDLFRRARAMKASGQPVTELTIGEHDIQTDPAILTAMDAAARGGHLGYASIPGVTALRDAVAARTAAQTGVDTTRDNVVIVPGAQAGLFAAHLGTCDPGDKALFIDPYYATYPGTIRAASARPVAVPARAEDGFQPRGAAIAAKAPGARSLLINSPNNPTGAVYGPETMAEIAEVAREHDLWLISDEVYDSQIWRGRHLSPRALPGMADRTLVVGSMSKAFAMTGSRIGWVIGPPHMIAHLIDLGTNTTYGVPGFIQDAAHYALTLGPEFEAQIAAPFRRRQAIVQRLLADQNRIRAVPSDATMYVMLDIRATGLTGDAFADRLLDRHAIAVMPGESFGRQAAGHIRVAMTVPDEDFEPAFQTLLDFAQEITP